MSSPFAARPKTEPCIALVMTDLDARRALLAELLESGIDAVGRESVGALLIDTPDAPEHGPLRAVLFDQQVVRERNGRLVELVRSRYRAASLVLLAGAATTISPWQLVLRKPITIGEIATALRVFCQAEELGLP
jgi:hypothetical protein